MTSRSQVKKTFRDKSNHRFEIKIFKLSDVIFEYSQNKHHLKFRLLFRGVVNEADPEDKPDKPEGSEEVEDRFPAEGVAQEAADRQRDDRAHLQWQTFLASVKMCNYTF